MHPPESDLIYDWNRAGGAAVPARGAVELDDETLRDGLQSPSVKSPSLEDKVRILHLMEALGIDSADIGLPGAGPHVVATVTRLAREIVDSKMRIRPNCAARTIAADIVPIIEISQKVGIPIEVACFIGSSPIRQYAEDWDLDRMLRMTEEAVSLAVSEGLPVMYVTEDTTRAHPDHIRRMYAAAIRAGARRVCVCDTVGHATPNGVQNLIRFVCGLVAEIDPERQGGLARPPGPRARRHQRPVGSRGRRAPRPCLRHRDRRARRQHADGPAPGQPAAAGLDSTGTLSKLHEYCEIVSRATGVPIPDNYPVVGRDAFRTGTGVHAAAIIKARKKGDEWLADRVYSGVPAAMVGRRQTIEVGPMSGLSNVQCWLENHGIEPRPELVEAVFRRAKQSDQVLSDEEILAVVHAFAAAPGRATKRPPRFGARGRGRISERAVPAYLDHLAVERGSPGERRGLPARSLGFGAWLDRQGESGGQPGSRDAAPLPARRSGSAGSPRARRRGRSRRCGAFFAFACAHLGLARRPDGQSREPAGRACRCRRPSSEKDVEALLRGAGHLEPLGLRDRAMLELLYASGLRVSEIVGLPRDRVDLDSGILRVTGKGGKERLVPFGASAARWIRALPGGGAARPGPEAVAQRSFSPSRGAADDPAALLAAHREVRPGRGDSGAADAPRPAPLLRDAPARARRRPARAPDDARPLRHRDDADLHAGLALAAARRLRRVPSATGGGSSPGAGKAAR